MTETITTTHEQKKRFDWLNEKNSNKRAARAAKNCAARLILDCRKYYLITQLLRELHWLPVETRITFRLLLTTFKALNNLVPCYISNLLHIYSPDRRLGFSSIHDQF